MIDVIGLADPVRRAKPEHTSVRRAELREAPKGFLEAEQRPSIEGNQ